MSTVKILQYRINKFRSMLCTKGGRKLKTHYNSTSFLQSKHDVLISSRRYLSSLTLPGHTFLKTFRQQSFRKKQQKYSERDKQSSINEIVERIKNKYKGALRIDSKTNTRLDYNRQHQSMLEVNAQEQQFNKQNKSKVLNSTMDKMVDIKQSEAIKKITNENKKKRRMKQSEKIQQLESINMKIANLIECLKQESSNSEESGQKSKGNEMDWQKKEQNEKRNGESNIFNIIQINQDLTRQNIKKNIFNNNFEGSERQKFYISTTSQTSNSIIENQAKFLKLSKNSDHLQRSRGQSRRSLTRQNGKISRGSSRSKNMQDIRKAYNENVNPGAYNQHVNFIKRLTHQIQLDETYLQNKARMLRSGKNYQQKLANCVKKLELSDIDKQILLQYSLEDFDPLYTERKQTKKQKQDLNYLIYLTIDSFLKSADHWKRKFINKFHEQELSLSQLDMQKKGYLLKEDLTRFISLQSKRLYHNRDINLIFKRINKKRNKILKVQQFIKTFCV